MSTRNAKKSEKLRKSYKFALLFIIVLFFSACFAPILVSPKKVHAEEEIGIQSAEPRKAVDGKKIRLALALEEEYQKCLRAEENPHLTKLELEKAHIRTYVTFLQLDEAYLLLSHNEKGAFFFFLWDEQREVLHDANLGPRSRGAASFSAFSPWRKRFEAALAASFPDTNYLHAYEGFDSVKEECCEKLKKEGLFVM